MPGNHPITPVLLATDLAAAKEFYHGQLGLQIDRKNENAIGFRYGNGTPGAKDRRRHLGSAAAGRFGAAW